MRRKLGFLGCAIAVTLFVAGCGESSKSKEPANEKVSTTSKISDEEVTARKAIEDQVPQGAVVRVPIDEKGNPDFDKMEVKSVKDRVNTDDAETLAGLFENGESNGSVESETGVEELGTSTESCYGGGCGYYRRGCGYGYRRSCGGYGYRRGGCGGYGYRRGGCGGYGPRRYGYLLPWRRRVANAMYGVGPMPRRYGYILPWRRNVARALYSGYGGYSWPYRPYASYGRAYRGHAYYGFNGGWGRYGRGWGGGRYGY